MSVESGHRESTKETGTGQASGTRVQSLKRHPLERPGLLFLTGATILLTGFVLWRALPYYLSPLRERPHFAVDDDFRPSGLWGHGLGILGGVVLTATLLYPLRKAWKRLRKLGRMAVWLRYHIWCGLAGPAVVTLHTAFKFGGLVAVSFWSMVAVMVSGFIGRYIYAQIPRSIAGHELSERELVEQDGALLDGLRNGLATDPGLLNEVERLSGLPGIAKARGLRLLALSIGNDVTRPWRVRSLDRRLRSTGHYSPALAGKIAKTARRRALLQRRIAALHVSRDLFRHWHTVHRPFAYVMFGIAIVHVVVALLFGYTWRLR
jgi:hypothetical protein